MASVNNTSSSTTTAYSYLQYKNKIGGLVSGMDIDSIMEKLMKAESAQMEKLQQQKQKYEWKRDAYREVNTKLNTFQQDLFDKYGLKSSWNSKTANVSNNSAVSVIAGTNASGNLSISKVEVAKAATSKFTAISSLKQQQISGATKLADIENFSLTDLSGTSFDGATTLENITTTLVAKGYSASVSNGKLNVSAGKEAQVLTANDQKVLEDLGVHFGGRQTEAFKVGTGDEAKVATASTKLLELGITSTSSDFTFKVKDGEEVTVAYDKNDTLESLFSKLKEKGLTASIDTEGKISFKAANGKDLESISHPFGTTKNIITSNDVKYTTVAGTSAVNAQGTNTIKELLGSNAQDGMFTLSAIQADGTMKETTITYKSTDTINSLISKINSSGAGVTAIFNDGQFSISANNTGDNEAGAEVSLLTTVKDESGTNVANTSGGLALFAKLTGLTTEGSTTTETAGMVEVSLASDGSNAKMTINGVNYEQNSNLFKVAGYEITAKENLAPTDKAVTVSSVPDTDKAVDKVKAFVETYNSLIKEINTKTAEKKKVGYDPLTDAQKAEMSESEITKWEEAAKAGLLKGDSTLNGVLSKMRQTLFTYGTSTSVSGSNKALGIKGETLSSIGITTSSTWSDNGKLEIDEDKLRSAIEKDPDILSRIFTGDGTEQNPGIVSQIRKTAQDAVKTIEKSAGKDTTASETTYSIGKTIKSLDDKITGWKDRLKDIEERYWNQFSAMESAIQKANSQSSIFSSGSY